jgi:hypothetical protein
MFIMHTTKIFVKDFVNPSADDSALAIREAIMTAIRTNAEAVVFEPGRYILKSFVKINTNGTNHDAGSKLNDSKDCHISIVGARNLALVGAVNSKGEPSTVLVGYNDSKNHSFLPALLWCEDCENFRVEGIAFSREPEYASAGVITDKSPIGITVEVFDGNPCYDGMGTYCMNRINPISKALVGESVTYGNGAENNWVKVGRQKLSLEDAKVASKVEIGEYLSWHQGAQTDFQVYFARCNNLILNNLRTYNSNSFCMLTENCNNISANKVVFKPDGNRLFTGPRDAWKLFKCSGVISINEMYVEGVRMDGQNMHSNWLFFKEKISPTEALFFCKYTFAPIIKNSIVEFYDKEKIEKLTVSEWKHGGCRDGGNYYIISFEDKIPAFAGIDTFCAAVCWEAERYICSNSEFVNIAGAGHLIRYDNLTLLNCKYKNIMNPGILLGAELPTHAEGGHATNILIKGCEFDNCGFFPRYGTSGCIGINSAGFKGFYNKSIIITDNYFKNSNIGIHINDAQDVFIINNHFENIGEPLIIDGETTERIFNYV